MKTKFIILCFLSTICSLQAQDPPVPESAQRKLADVRQVSTDYARVVISAFRQMPNSPYLQVAVQRVLLDALRKDERARINAMRKFIRQSLPEGDAFRQRMEQLIVPPDSNLTRRLLGGELLNYEADSEYWPVITASGKQLFFCRRARNTAIEKIYYSERQSDGSWSEAIHLDHLDPTTHHAPVNTSLDGNQLLIFSGGEIGSIEKTADGWTDFRAMPPAINCQSWQCMGAFSTDGERFIFAVDGHPEGEGRVDLFITQRDSLGNWGEAVPLSDLLNSPGVDRCPFLHPDNKTLYFSSDGLGGYGNLDIFVTRRLDDSWTNWSTPVNLGKTINTAGKNWGFRISTDGRTAYFSDTKGTSPLKDMYAIELPAALRPLEVKTITGKLLSDDGQVREAEIIIRNQLTGEAVNRVRTDPETGEYLFVLPDDGSYSYEIQPLDDSHASDPKLSQDSTALGIDLVEADANYRPIPLKPFQTIPILFEFAQAELDASARLELERVANYLKDNDLHVRIIGHTDAIGSVSANRKLSENRAASVRRYLIDLGLSSQRMYIEGRGEEEPVSPNASEAARARNRRVELYLEPPKKGEQ